MTSPYYSGGNTLLKQGLSDFSYNLGLLRPQFGQTSDPFGSVVLAFFHRKGITDQLTLGVRGEATKDLANEGVSFSTNLGGYGILSGAGAASNDFSGNTGAAASTDYSYANGSFSLSLSGQVATDGYQTVGESTPTQRQKNNVGFTVGWGNSFLGFLSGQVQTGQMFDNSPFTRSSLSYTRALTPWASLSASLFSNRQNGQMDNQAYLTFSFTPDAAHIAFAGVQAHAGQLQATTDVQRALPSSEGYGYEIKASTTPGDGSSEIQPRFSRNMQHFSFDIGTDATDVKGTWLTSSTANLSGAILWTGNTVAFTRTVSDSFAIVETNLPAGVKIYSNNVPVAETDREGKAIFPGLPSFVKHTVSLGSDVPIEFTLSKTAETLYPSYRSGNRICFASSRLQSLTGEIVTAKGTALSGPIVIAYTGSTEPTSSALTGGSYNIPRITELVSSSETGEFYLDSSVLKESVLSINSCDEISKPAPSFKPGSYHASVGSKDGIYSFVITVPNGDSPLVNLGKIVAYPWPDSSTKGAL